MKHWTYFLQEAGTITKQGEQQVCLQEEINILQEKLAKLREKHKATEVELYKLARKEWQLEEIDEANAKAYFMNRDGKLPELKS